MWGYSEDMAFYGLGRGPSLEAKSAGDLILDFPSYRTVGNEFLFFIDHLIYGILLQQLKWTKILSVDCK